MLGVLITIAVVVGIALLVVLKAREVAERRRRGVPGSPTGPVDYRYGDVWVPLYDTDTWS